VVNNLRWQLDIDESPALISTTRYLPWRDLLDAGTSWAPGYHTYTRALVTYADPGQPLLITNNLDAMIYIARQGIVPEIKGNPLLIVPPFYSMSLPAPGPQMSIVADCAGYDFASKRVNVAADDVRFGSGAALTIGPTPRLTDPVQLRKGWTRLYDTFDLTYNNPFVTLTTGSAWFSNLLALEGSSGLTAYGEFQAGAATGSGINFYITESFPSTGTGNFVVGNQIDVNTPAGPGFFYQQISLAGAATPSPRVEWFYLPGGTPAVQVVLQNILLTISMSS
jgi:hypothetical protein